MSAASFVAGALVLPSLLLAALLLRLLIGSGAWLGGITLARMPDRPRNRAVHAAIVACAERAWVVQVGPLALSLAVDRSDGEQRPAVVQAVAETLGRDT